MKVWSNIVNEIKYRKLKWDLRNVKPFVATDKATEVQVLAKSKDKESPVKKVRLKIPKQYKLLEISVGDSEHQPTEDQLKRLSEHAKICIKKKRKVFVVPYWVKMRVVE